MSTNQSKPVCCFPPEVMEAACLHLREMFNLLWAIGSTVEQITAISLQRSLLLMDSDIVITVQIKPLLPHELAARRVLLDAESQQIKAATPSDIPAAPNTRKVTH